MNIWKKSLLTFFAIFIVLTSIFPKGIQAQTWYAPTLEEFTAKVQNAPENEIFGERYTQAQIYWILYSLVNFAIGQGVTGCTKDPAQTISCIQKLFDGSSGFIPGTGSTDTGIVLPLASLVDQTIQYRPASGIAYFKDKIDRLNITSTAYAQEGFGYGTLSPATPLWTATRNASYGLMIIVMVVLAFMIMFRTKISPQASLSVQIAIPRIIIALILITFSFAIAGFLIDLAYLVLGLLGAIFGLGGISTWGPAELYDALQHWGNGMLSIGIIWVMLLLVPAAIAVWIPVIQVPAVIAAILILIIVLIVYLIAIVKILWVMFRGMLMITMLIIFSPLYILWGVVSPSTGFGSWLKSFVGNLSIFVTIPLLIFLTNVVMWGSFGPTSGSELSPTTWLNPYRINTTLLAGGVELPGFFGGFNPIVGMIGGLVLLVSASKLASGIRDLIITGRGQLGLADAKSALGPIYGLAAFAGGTIGGGIGAYGRGRVTQALTNWEAGRRATPTTSSTTGRAIHVASRGVRGGSTGQIKITPTTNSPYDPVHPKNYRKE